MMAQVRTADIGITQGNSEMVQLYVPPNVTTLLSAFNVQVNFAASTSVAVASLPTNEWLLVWRPSTGNATTYPVTQGAPSPP